MSPRAAVRVRLIGGILWIALGLVDLGTTLRETTSKGPFESRQFELCLGGLCLLIGLAVLAWWKVGRWLALLGGGLVGLYGVALILLGTEDVGGLAVSLPIGGALMAFGVWNAVAASLRTADA